MVEDRWRPDVIINAAAATNVDGCETDRAEAWRDNVDLVETIVEVCRKIDARLVQVSTDYVFDGEAGPYVESDRPNPINYYGKTKLAAENVCLRSGIDVAIVRTMWLYGAGSFATTPDARGISPMFESPRGYRADHLPVQRSRRVVSSPGGSPIVLRRPGTKRSFVDWVVESIVDGKTINVVQDEIGNPTHIEDVAYSILKIVERKVSGLLHISGKELISRLDWAHTICRAYDLDGSELIRPISAAQLPRKAPRPLKSGLITTKATSMLDYRPLDAANGLQMHRIRTERSGVG
jgi:dTDP-4-dehydrorhamnose reductase